MPSSIWGKSMRFWSSMTIPPTAPGKSSASVPPPSRAFTYCIAKPTAVAAWRASLDFAKPLAWARTGSSRWTATGRTIQNGFPSMVVKSRDADVVIGSRLIPGGGEEGRSRWRGLITWGANQYIRFMLDLSVHDATTGYRLFSRRCLAAMPWNAFRATGPEIVQEVLLAAHNPRLRDRRSPHPFCGSPSWPVHV